MHRLAISTLGLLALAACQREPVETVTPASPTPVEAAAATSVAVEGWQTDPAAYPLIGKTLPGFTATLHGGAAVTQDALRGHWTILGFWNQSSDDSVADARYIQALNSAVGQDPDLDLLTIHIPPTPESLGTTLDAWFTTQGGPWPTVLDSDGKIATSFGIATPPSYLLVGPDLTIEGYRGALNATPDDGIKSVIRGVAEIRKQIAAPG